MVQTQLPFSPAQLSLQPQPQLQLASPDGMSSRKVYVVTRHAGAIDWMMQALGDVPSSVVSHLDGIEFAPGDVVCGVLPLSWAARICAAGAQAHVLTYDTPEALRGRELSADDLHALGARLVRYDVRVLT